MSAIIKALGVKEDIMPVERALIAFRTRKKNCAQSVLFGFQELLAIPDADIEAARKLGHGRAEEGRCGALHAALQLSQNSMTKEQLKQVFKNTAGSEHCREIRAGRQSTCDACVELAAAILLKSIETNRSQEGVGS